MLSNALKSVAADRAERQDAAGGIGGQAVEDRRGRRDRERGLVADDDVEVAGGGEHDGVDVGRHDALFADDGSGRNRHRAAGQHERDGAEGQDGGKEDAVGGHASTLGTREFRSTSG